MKRLIMCSVAVLFSTAAMAQNPTGSGQTPGGPARGNISERVVASDGELASKTLPGADTKAPKYSCRIRHASRAA
jgi:hypothetical protein